ncbi:MAG: radical SAM protein [Bacteriovoracaceae bacterium]|nr:radical SAM protein [Bacteriovoracaceae bacterium]
MKILLALPPMTQFNMPYPSTAYLKGYLEKLGHDVFQSDWSVELIDSLFSSNGLERIKGELSNKNLKSEKIDFFLEAFNDYQKTIDSVIAFLRGNDPSLALRISKRNFLPEGPRFQVLEDMPNWEELYGEMGIQDKAKYLASLYIDDLSDYISEGIDADFSISRYGEKLASSMNSFNPLYQRLKKKTLIDEMLEAIVTKNIEQVRPDFVGLSLPFPGNLLGALRACEVIKSKFPKISIGVGGGYVNTELRSMQDIRPFKFFDYLIFDDGEVPLEMLLGYLEGKKKEEELVRTWFLKDSKIFKSELTNKNLPYKEHPGPTFVGLPLDKYISLCEMPNSMHRMWSDFRWNKMILAHGCYWKKCTFCDISIDYIGRYEPAKAKQLVDQIERIIAETKQTGFHFVDEAAPPALIKTLCKELIERKVNITWWGNLRFDPHFNQELCQLMADAGCVAVTGGLEVANERILKLINKGISIEQVKKVTKNFSDAGIYVHAYLMYGFPTQTKKETIQSLEVVRQLFKNNHIQSAYWHRFACTVHSPVGRDPEKFSVQLFPQEIPAEGLFAQNEIAFDDGLTTNHDTLGESLKLALYNYMHSNQLDAPVKVWF